MSRWRTAAGPTALVDATRQAEARREPLRIVADANRPVIGPIEVTGLEVSGARLMPRC